MDFFTFGSSTKCTLPSLVDNLGNDIQEIKLPIYEKDGKLLTQILFNSIVRAVIDKVEGCEDVLTEDYICFLLEQADVVRTTTRALLSHKFDDRNGSRNIDSIMEEVYIRSDDKKVTRFDACNKILCFVLMSALLSSVHTRNVLFKKCDLFLKGFRFCF